MARKLDYKIPEQELYQMYVIEGKSMKEIARHYNVTSATILYWLRKNGIETRDQKSTFSFKGHKHSQSAKKKSQTYTKAKYCQMKQKPRYQKAIIRVELDIKRNGKTVILPYISQTTLEALKVAI